MSLLQYPKNSASEGTIPIFRECFTNWQTFINNCGIFVGAPAISNGLTINTGNSDIIYFNNSRDIGNGLIKFSTRIKFKTPSSFSANTYLLSKRNNTPTEKCQLIFEVTSGAGLFIFVPTSPTDLSTYYAASGTLSASTIYDFVFSFDGSLSAANRVVIYLNGAVQSGSWVGTCPANLQANQWRWIVGGYENGGISQAGYIIYEIGIYNRALSLSDVQAIYSLK